MVRARKPKAEAMDLPGVDTRPRGDGKEVAWVVDFTKKPLGYHAGRGMRVVMCPRCDKRGLERKDSNNIRTWEHVREYYVHGTGRTSSRASVWCREKF